MTVNTLLANLLLPPMGVALLALVALLAGGRFGRAVALVSVVALLAFAMPATAMSLIAALERDLPLAPNPADPPRAIVLLGGDEARTEDPGAPRAIGAVSLARTRAAAVLARRVDLPILASGGDPWQEGAPIAVLMARALADDFGRPAHWIEPASLDTWDNARQSATLLSAAGIRSVYVVTDAWHMRRALIAFRHFGINATASPVLLDPWPKGRPSEFIPQAEGWLASYDALHEWIGCALYLLRSRIQRPPETVRIDPVTYDAAGESSQATASATSSG